MQRSALQKVRRSRVVKEKTMKKPKKSQAFAPPGVPSLALRALKLAIFIAIAWHITELGFYVWHACEAAMDVYAGYPPKAETFGKGIASITILVREAVLHLRHMV